MNSEEIEEIKENANKLYEIAQDYLGVYHEQYAELSSIASKLYSIANELEPPKPIVMPGDPILWRWKSGNRPYRHGIYELGERTRTAFGEQVDLEKTDWKPARLLGPRQKAVDIPPVREWPDWATALYVAFVDNSCKTHWITPLISKGEAERMGAEDET